MPFSLLAILLLGNSFHLTIAKHEVSEQGGQIHQRSEDAIEFTLENAKKVGATPTKFHIPETHCEFEGKEEDGEIHFTLTRACPVTQLAPFFAEANIKALENSMIHGKRVHAQKIILKKNKEETIVIDIMIRNGPILFNSMNSGAYMQSLMINAEKKGERKYYIEFVCSIRSGVQITFKSSYDDPEMYTAASEVSSISVTRLLNGIGISTNFLANDHINYNTSIVKGSLTASYKADTSMELTMTIDKHSAAFMQQHPSKGYLFVQQTFGEIELPTTAALIFLYMGTPKVQEIIQDLGYQTQLNLFKPAILKNVALMFSNGNIAGIRTRPLLSYIANYITPESQNIIQKGINLLMERSTRSSSRKITYIGHLADQLVITTDSNITSNVKSIVEVFKDMPDNLERSYRQVESDTQGMFWKAVIPRGAHNIAEIKINVSSSLQVMTTIMDIKNLTWSFRFDSSSSNRLSAVGENYVVGEVTSTVIRFEGSNITMKGELKRAFSVKQLLLNAGVNATYMLGFEHLIMHVISGTTFAITLSSQADDRSLRITAESSAIGCTNEQIVLKFYKVSNGLRSGVDCICNSRVYLHHVMERLYLKEVVREQWILLKTIHMHFGVKYGHAQNDVSFHMEQINMCPASDGASRDSQTLCSFLKNRVADQILIIGEMKPSEFQFQFQSVTSTLLNIDLKVEPVISRELTLSHGAPQLSYIDGKSSFRIRCLLKMNSVDLDGLAVIKTLGQGKPYIELNLEGPTQYIMGENWVRLERGSKGYAVIDPTKALRLVFTSNITIGAASIETAKLLNGKTTLTLGDGIKPRLVAYLDDHDTIAMTLRRFGAAESHRSLQGIHFINGYTIKYCGNGAGVCSLPGYSITHTSKLMITGRIFYFAATIDVTLYASETTLIIEGTTSVMKSPHGKVTFQRENEDGTGPRFSLASVNRPGGVDKAIFHGHLFAEGITYTGDLHFIERDGRTLPSLAAEHVTTSSWHGDIDSFQFTIFIDPNPTFENISYEIQAYLKHGYAVNLLHMKDTLAHYIAMVEKSQEEASITESEVGSRKKSLESLIEEAKTNLLSADDRLDAMSQVLTALEPTLIQECVDECREASTNLFGVAESNECPEDDQFQCLQWQHLPNTVIDYNCVARCEAEKIINRDTINRNWQTAEIMLPKYKNMVHLSHFLQSEQATILNLQQQIQSYLTTVTTCIGGSYEEMKDFEESFLDYSIHIPEFSSTIKMEDRLNVNNKCYQFELRTYSNGEEYHSQFEGCLNGEFQKRIDAEIFKHIGIDVLGIEACLQGASKSYADNYKNTEALVERVKSAINKAEDYDSTSSEKRTKIPKEKSSRFRFYKEKLGKPVTNVVTRGEKTTQAFAKFVPWVHANNLKKVKEFERRTKDTIFNSTYSPANSINCHQSRRAIDTYQKLSRSLYSMTKSYKGGQKDFLAYKKSLDKNLDKLEISLFQKYVRLNPGTGSLRDMTYWIKESRKGNMKLVEDMKSALDYQNRNSIATLKHQVQNYVTGIDGKLTAGTYLTSLVGVLDASERRFNIPGNSPTSQIQNLIGLFVQDGVTVEDASATISDLWHHSKKLSQIQIKC